ncbi:undecaprenyl/decaprenyl-phosphate alpha-N-acetylglucosaminyl 1-phosphate transferase [Candidatus Falkowbacteria bacterium]|nr:undecaprenyl/decaprenyl-phosphate alpha-N-acetylglucosaminyl 1-phosphate transferase [Candidatus Falkowbacteria bacterium]
MWINYILLAPLEITPRSFIAMRPQLEIFFAGFNIPWEFLMGFIAALAFSIVFTILVKKIAFRAGAVDKPDAERRLHTAATPLLGGLAVFAAFFIIVYLARGYILAGNLESRHWLGVFIGACFLMIGGFLDDKYKLKPSRQFIFPVLAIMSVLVGGVQIEKITNPLGGFFYLENFKLVSGGLIAVWLLGMMYTTKLLDGVDGLVSGITAIGALIIFLFTMTTRYYQPDIGLAALILAGVCLGFLIFNWHPAKIFLGEGGSLFLGFILGVLAIISGGKIAIALLVMGLPIMDVAWTIIRRLAAGQNPFKFADRGHLHFRLLDLGLGAKKTVLIFYFFFAVFGLSALFLQSRGKLAALAVLVVVMLGVVMGFRQKDKIFKFLIL